MIKKITQASSVLVSSNFIVALGGLITISLIAKKLTIGELGILAIIQTYVLALNSLINFQTWYTVNKYYPHVKTDCNMLNSLLKYSYRLDIITASIGTLIAILLINFVGTYINIPDSYIFITQIFSFSILFNITGTATGYFRSIDKYKVFLYSDIWSILFKISGILFCFFYYPSIEAFLLVILVSYIIKTLYLNYLLIRTKLQEIWFSDTKLIRSKFNDIYNFSIITSLTNGFDILFRQGDILVVSMFFGTQCTGIYKMVKTFSSLISTITGPLSIVIYPIVSELIKENKQKELISLTLKSIIYLSFVGIIGFGLFLLIEEYLIKILFREEYLNSIHYLNIYILITIISVIFMILHPITNLIGLHKEVMYLIIAKIPVFIGLIYWLKDDYGFMSFFIAVFIETIITIIIKALWVYARLKNKKSISA